MHIVKIYFRARLHYALQQKVREFTSKIVAWLDKLLQAAMNASLVREDDYDTDRWNETVTAMIPNSSPLVDVINIFGSGSFARQATTKTGTIIVQQNGNATELHQVVSAVALIIIRVLHMESF